MRRIAALAGALVFVALGPLAVARADTLVTHDSSPGSYQRADGGIDATMTSCSTGRRTQNEPTVAVDPNNPAIMTAGSNDYCAEIQNGNGNVWAGYYRSTNGGATWSLSLVPGYPADTSAFGTQSPAHGSCAAAGDPTQSFDRDGRLYYGFICFNRVKPTNGSIYVARYDNDGASYIRTVRVDRGTPSVWGLFQDKINIAVDQTTGPNSGNVYVAWARYPGQAANNVIYFARSTDGGQTFSSPMRLTQGQREEQFADIGIGPNGAVYVTYREIAHQKSTENRVRIVRSTDGGQSFSLPQTVADIVPFDSTDFGPDTCGDGPFACDNGLTYARFSSLSAVAADASGVHVVWNARTATGQSKVFVRNSPDGLTWTAPAVAVSGSPSGHQFFPDIATGAGVLRVVFQDSRTDPAYSFNVPPGNTPGGVNSGDVVQAIVARSLDGGTSWSEATVSTAGTNPNWEVRGAMRSPFFGDYNYTSATATAAASVWTDTRDLTPGSDPRETLADDDADNFDGFQTCSWIPNDINAPSYSQPTIADACLSQGGLDQNIYIATAP
jgi:hypothetical protein